MYALYSSHVFPSIYHREILHVCHRRHVQECVLAELFIIAKSRNKMFNKSRKDKLQYINSVISEVVVCILLLINLTLQLIKSLFSGLIAHVKRESTDRTCLGHRTAAELCVNSVY